MVPLNMEFCRLQEKQGLVKTISIGAPFMNAANVCGLENLLRWMFKKPDLAHRLLRIVTDYGIRLARYWVETFGPEKLNSAHQLPHRPIRLFPQSIFRNFPSPI